MSERRAFYTTDADNKPDRFILERTGLVYNIRDLNNRSRIVATCYTRLDADIILQLLTQHEAIQREHNGKLINRLPIDPRMN